MARGSVRYLVVPLLVLSLAGCRFFDYEERDPWRAEAEAQCLAGGRIQPSEFLQPASPVNGKGTCGMTRPLKVSGLANGRVAVAPKATLACPIVAHVEGWFEEAVQPAAMAWFGEPVTEIRQISAYSCRTMNGRPGATISEHAFGNALDISTFKLASGRVVTVKDGWKGKPEERGFLRNVHAGACGIFSTVLGPGADMFHYDHFHLDLMRRSQGREVCRPAPQTVRPPARPQHRAPEGVPVARAPAHSPWAKAAAHPPRGPAVLVREAAPRAQPQPAAGAPLVLAPQSPPPDRFGAPLRLEDRLQQSFGTPSAAPPRTPRPPASDPLVPVPPAAVPQARRGGDPVVTGSIEKPAPSAPEADLLSPRSLMELKRFDSEAASVFDLPRKDEPGR